MAAPASAASVTLTLSSAVGPGTSDKNTAPSDAVTITASATSAWLSGYSAQVKAVLSVAACATTVPAATTDTAPVAGSTTTGLIVVDVTATRLTDYKAAIGIPANLPMATTSPQKYNICVYSSSTATAPLIGSAAYTAAVPPTATKVTPASGLATGGNTITITGSGFPTTSSGLTGTLGGVPLTGVTALGPSTFKATVPAGKPNTTAVLTVTTTAGTATLQAAYKYANGINIAPNTAPNTADQVYVDVMGSGFSGLSFESKSGVGGAGRLLTPALDTKARVFLVSGVYDPSIINTNEYKNGPFAECGAVAVISDRELICGMDLTNGYDPAKGTVYGTKTAVKEGTYTLTVVNVGKLGATVATDDLLQTDLSSGSTFTVAPY
ncbi:hypothetical protein Areg01_55220 [Actinoplanes regularis]|nr:hypothetical protein Areg01_55220 [Actinoplanes regularis]